MNILYEDNHCIAVSKPHGLPTQEDESGDESLMDQVRDFIKERDQKPGNVFLGLVHRLDRPVGGVVLFAKTSKGASRLAEQFREHRIEKIYWAVVEGLPDEPEGTVIQYIKKDNQTNRVRASTSLIPGAKKAETFYKMLKGTGRRTLMELRPKTGRPHQLRLAMSTLGLPIVGDLKYGSTTELGPAIALFAKSLTFEQPVTKEKITVLAKPEHPIFSSFS